MKNHFPTNRERQKATRMMTAVIAVIIALYAAYNNYQTRRENAALAENAGGKLAVHFIDVGQGDAALIMAPDGSAMLIDCGTTESASYLVKYLHDMNVQSLEYLLITHPHEDHYGGAEKVIQHFPVENFVIHEDFTDAYPFDRFALKLAEKPFDMDTAIVQTKRNDEFLFADCAPFCILSPQEIAWDDYNDSSLVLKLIFGETSFLFTGDAEKGAEREILAKGYDVRADVLSAGHHGSSTSNTAGFVETVLPEYAVISCGKNNDYGHPHEETLQTFKENGVKILRTDLQGTIVLTSDGKTVKPLGAGG